MDGDPFELSRFVTAQNEHSTYDRALGELRAGRKTSHWMWFVFPQVDGLGMSSTSRFYAIRGLDEARAYFAHPVLGQRLVESARVVADVPDRSAEDVLGGIDAQKLRSCMTLFHRAQPDEPVFAQVLARYFGGLADPATDRLLAS